MKAKSRDLKGQSKNPCCISLDLLGSGGLGLDDESFEIVLVELTAEEANSRGSFGAHDVHRRSFVVEHNSWGAR
jgi:hypothetical protein